MTHKDSGQTLSTQPPPAHGLSERDAVARLRYAGAPYYGRACVCGLDRYRGFSCTGYDRSALALDIMEPFRPITADSVVFSVVNVGEVNLAECVVATMGTAPTAPGRRHFVAVFERRLSQETTRPLFGYRVSLRRLLLVQARVLSRFLLGEVPAYSHHPPR
jgi:CRISPR-associated protein Cas1